MQYGITRLINGERSFIEIEEEGYRSILLAKERVLQVLGIEEKFNTVLENYAEFEQTLLEITLDFMLFSGHDWSAFMEPLHQINRRLLNFLASCRLYLDHVPQSLGAILPPNKEGIDKFKEKASEQYDAHIAYRALEALRNYGQHRDTLIHRLSSPSWRDDNGAGDIKHTVTPYLEVAYLREDTKFKRKILEELNTLGDRIDLKPLVRAYIAGLGKIHDSTTDMLKDHVQTWKETLNGAIQEYREEVSDDLAGLAIVIRDKDGILKDSQYLIEDWVKRLEWLQRKNWKMKHYEKLVVTSEVKRK